MSIGQGWFGTLGQLQHFLRTMGCDTDDQEQFLIRGESPQCVTTMLGIGGPDADTCVDSTAQFRFHVRGVAHIGTWATECPDCHWTGLAAGLGGTSYGTRPIVIA